MKIKFYFFLKRIVFGFLVLIQGWLSYGQQINMGYSQIAKDLFASSKKYIVYKNIHFTNDLPNEGAEIFTSNSYYPPSPVKIFGGFKEYLKSLGVSKNSSGKFCSTMDSIIFENCSFDSDLRFSCIDFKGILSFKDVDFPKKSEDFYGAYGQIFGGAIFIDSCKMGGLALLMREDHPYRFFFKLNNSKISNFLQLELQKSSTEIINTKVLTSFAFVQVHKESTLDINKSVFQGLDLGLYNIDYLKFSNSTIDFTKDEFQFFNMDAKEVDFIKNSINANLNLIFNEGLIKLSENKINKKLALYFNAIENRSSIQLSSLKNLDFGIIHNGKFFNAQTKSQVKDAIGYRKFLRINKIIYDYFKEVGDINSANSSFVKIKEIENNKLKFEYEDLPSFQNYFNLNLNRLLKFYTNYGTDPAKAIVVSFYLLFIFAILYLFFPSDWDITSKSKLISNFKDFIKKNEKGYFKPFMQLILGFTISFINALMLSLNAFTTLGFGNIPTKGVGRYICILQGFIGWFLLSIFTVALFNQTQY